MPAAGLGLALSLPMDTGGVFGAGASAPANSVLPAITGGLVEGTVQTVSTGTWTNSPTLFTYQWVLGAYPGVPILGATSSTYTPTVGQIGLTLGAIVTASNGGGSVSANATGAGIITAPVTGALRFNLAVHSMYVPLISARDQATVTTSLAPRAP